MALSRKYRSSTNGYTSHQFHNSKSSTNAVAPDILYYIFKLAFSESLTPTRTVLNISHVCRHWRNMALESPILWSLINLDMSRSLVDLFLSRSGNAPLAMSWTHPPLRDHYFYNSAPLRKVYRECIADPDHVFPRINSLNLHLAWSELIYFYHVVQKLEVAPLQLRRLDIWLIHDSVEAILGPPPLILRDIVRVNPSYLQELVLQGVDITGIELPPDNRLTHFKFSQPPNMPLLSHFLKFLSICSSLQDLELHFFDVEADKLDIADSDPFFRSMVNLDLPKLKGFEVLTAEMTGHLYIRSIASRIKTTSLSRLFTQHLNYLYIPSPSRRIYNTTISPDIFETIPRGALSAFSGHRYMQVSVRRHTFAICTAPYYLDQSAEGTQLFHVAGPYPSTRRLTQFDHLAPIMDTIRALPGITDLDLISHAWQLPWVSDIPDLFPCLDTLRLKVLDSDDLVTALKTLPENLKLRKLVLLRPTLETPSIGILLNVVLRAEVRSLELEEDSTEDDQAQILGTALKGHGVEFVRVRGLQKKKECDCFDCTEDDRFNGYQSGNENMYDSDDSDGMCRLR